MNQASGSATATSSPARGWSSPAARLRVALEHLGDARAAPASTSRARRQVGGVADVDVRDLVVGDRERARRPRVEVLHAGLRVDLEQAGAAERAVDVDRPARVGDPVLGEHDDGVAAARACVDAGRRATSSSSRGRAAASARSGPKRWWS